MELRRIRTGRLLVLGALTLGLGAMMTFEPVQASGQPGAVTTFSTEFADRDCGAQLAEAMRDLQAEVTGPLAGSDYDHIRSIFAPLCSAQQSVLTVDETGRRISTAPLNSAAQARRPVAPSTPAQPIDPVLLLDLDLPRERPYTPPAE